MTDSSSRQAEATANDRPAATPGELASLAKEAQARNDWAGALACWDDCFAAARAAPPLAWRNARAWALLRVGRIDEAEASFAALCDEAPDDSRPLFGLVTSVMRQERWADAVKLWDRLIGGFAGSREAAWLITRARCLQAAGQRAEAAEAYAALLDLYPEQSEAHHSYVWLLMALGRPQEAAAASARALRIRPNDRRLVQQAAWIAIKRDDMPAARTSLQAAIVAADSVHALESIFPLLPSAFEGWARTRAWLELEHRLHALWPFAGAGDAEAAAVLAMRLKLALRDYDGFLGLLDRVPPGQAGAALAKLRHTGRLLRSDHFPAFSAEKVFGIGLGRTGTSSLTRALEILGFEAAHYYNSLTYEILRVEDAFLFDAMTDISVSGIFERLYHLFPNAKFIYTTRAMADWLASARRHNERVFGAGRVGRQGVLATTRGAGRHGAARALVVGPLLFHHAGLEAARCAFEHRVRSFFDRHDPTRLLEFDAFAGDGWEKLCGFLGRPVPDSAFPWENSSAAPLGT